LNKTVKKNSKILVMCAIGGTLDTLVSYRREKKLYNDPERQFGRELSVARLCEGSGMTGGGCEVRGQAMRLGGKAFEHAHGLGAALRVPADQRGLAGSWAHMERGGPL
jgi:hypothetical protein